MTNKFKIGDKVVTHAGHDALIMECYHNENNGDINYTIKYTDHRGRVLTEGFYLDDYLRFPHEWKKEQDVLDKIKGYLTKPYPNEFDTVKLVYINGRVCWYNRDTRKQEWVDMEQLREDIVNSM